MQFSLILVLIGTYRYFSKIYCVFRGEKNGTCSPIFSTKNIFPNTVSISSFRKVRVLLSIRVLLQLLIVWLCPHGFVSWLPLAQDDMLPVMVDPYMARLLSAGAVLWEKSEAEICSLLSLLSDDWIVLFLLWDLETSLIFSLLIFPWPSVCTWLPFRNSAAM